MTSEQKKTFWQQHIDGWRQSPLSQQDYCKQQDLAFSSFGYWRTRLKRLSQPNNKAKANQQEPYAYLRHIVTELPKATGIEQIEALLPWNVSLQDGVY